MNSGVPLDDGSIDIEWRESLPTNCPLPGSTPLEDQVLIRLIGPNELTDKDFDSYTALGYDCPDPKLECQWSACSMFKSTVTRSHLTGLKRYPRLRKKTAVAFVRVDQSAGRAYGDREHVDVWFYRQFRPLENVVNQVPLDEYEPT